MASKRVLKVYIWCFLNQYATALVNSSTVEIRVVFNNACDVLVLRPCHPGLKRYSLQYPALPLSMPIREKA